MTFIDFVREQWATIPPVVTADLEGKTVLLIGANTGIGFEATKHFARMNPGRLILACRSRTKGQAALERLSRETGYENAELWIIDLGEFASVKSFADKFLKDGGRLDLLIENAATLPICNAMFQATRDGWELAGIHVEASIETRVLESSNPLKFFGSEEYCTPDVLDVRRYRDTKLLNIFFVRALNDRLQGLPLIINSVNPGLCVSELRRNISGTQGFVYWIMDRLLARTSEQGSRQVVRGAVGGKEDAEELRGAYISSDKVCEPSDYVADEEGRGIQNRLWDNLVSELAKIDPSVRNIVEKYLAVPDFLICLKA